MDEKLLIELLNRFLLYGDCYAVEMAQLENEYFMEKSNQAIKDNIQLQILINFLNDGEFQFVKVENYQK